MAIGLLKYRQHWNTSALAFSPELIRSGEIE
jgi:hypothetical protein